MADLAPLNRQKFFPERSPEKTKARDTYAERRQGLILAIGADRKWALQTFLDATNLERALDEHKGDTIFSLAPKIREDLDNFSHTHPTAGSVIRDWKGDMKNEIMMTGPEGAGKVKQYHDDVTLLEQEGDSEKAVIDALFKEVLALIDKPPRDHATTDNEVITRKIHELNTHLRKWADFEEKVATKIKEYDAWMSTYTPKTTELDNYKNVDAYIDDILNLDGNGQPQEYGRGKFSLMHINDRRAFLLRFQRTIDYMKAIKDKKSEATRKKVQDFLMQGSSGALFLSTNYVEETKTGLMYYNDCLEERDGTIKLKRNYDRHLLPNEAFSIIFEGLANPSGPCGPLMKSMLSGNGEWMSMAFKRDGNTLIVAEDPTNLFWKNNDYQTIRNEDIQCKGNKKDPYKITGNDEFIHINSLEQTDSALVLRLWGTNASTVIQQVQAAGYSTEYVGIWAKNDKKWRPVARGYGDSNFDLYASNCPRASRGVRRKGA